MAAPNFTLVIVTCSGRPPLDGYAYRSMRVAVISDIHGNVAALEAVLPDIAREKVDLIAVCGDVASGPLPVETLHVLRALPDATFVRDDADTRIATTGVSLRCGGGGRSVRAHTHAVRPDGRPRTRHQPRQRGNALRRAGRILGRDGS